VLGRIGELASTKAIGALINSASRGGPYLIGRPRQFEHQGASTMPRIRRVNGADDEPIETADSSEGVNRILEGLGLGRYHVDEISAEPLRSGHTSRRWGVGI
jgi:hypothetical protein